MVMQRTTFPKDLDEGLNAHFGDEYRDLPEEWPRCFNTEGSRKASEEDVLMTGFGAAAVKPEGAPVTYDDGMQGWSARYVHETIALAFAITEEAIEDNLYFSLGPKYARALARALKHTKEIKGAAVLNNGFDANYTGGDGVSLFSTAHPILAGGTQSNKLATPADFSEAALEDILIMIRKAKDDRNVPKALMATDIIIPPDTEFDASRVLRSNLRPGTSDNDINAIRYKGIFAKEPHVVTRLTDADAWFVKTNCPDGLKHFRRKGVSRGTEGDFETGNVRYKARERYSFGHSDWRGAYASEGAA